MYTLLDVLRKADGSVPPDAVRSACRRGLELAPEYGGDGLTEGAKARARSMAGGESVSADTLKRIKAFHDRHTYEKQASPPSPGYVAYMLWGGSAGKTWANSQADSGDAEKSDSGKKGKNGLIGGIGARQWADKEAKRKGKPKAYANAIYSKLTHKSISKGEAMQAHKLYAEVISKSEGSRGGEVIGHTRSGAAVYAKHGTDHAAYDKFNKQDHLDAAKHHVAQAKKYASASANSRDGNATKRHEKNMAQHNRRAESHQYAAGEYKDRVG